MGAPQYLQDAGLFHSVYGTVYFMPEGGLVENRQNVKDLIDTLGIIVKCHIILVVQLESNFHDLDYILLKKLVR